MVPFISASPTRLEFVPLNSSTGVGEVTDAHGSEDPDVEFVVSADGVVEDDVSADVEFVVSADGVVEDDVSADVELVMSADVVVAESSADKQGAESTASSAKALGQKIEDEDNGIAAFDERSIAARLKHNRDLTAKNGRLLSAFVKLLSEDEVNCKNFPTLLP